MTDSKEDYEVVHEGDDLEPLVGRKIQIIAEVSNTKYPSIGDYWLTVMGLENVRGMKVHVWGELEKRIETTVDDTGAISQGREGTFYYLVNIGYSLVE